MMASAVLSAPLLIRGASCLGPWGGQLCPPYPDPPAPSPAPEPLPGFVESDFNPLISFAVRGALAAAGEPPAPDTGMVLVTSFGDTETADAASRRLAAGRPASPLLFYQSIPNSILGHLGREFGMTGPITCVSAGSRLLSEGLTLAESLLDEGAAGDVLLVGVDLAPNERVRAVHEARRACRGGIELHAGDIVAAVVVQQPAAGRVGLRLVGEPRPPERVPLPPAEPEPRPGRRAGGFRRTLPGIRRPAAGPGPIPGSGPRHRRRRWAPHGLPGIHRQ